MDDQVSTHKTAGEALALIRETYRHDTVKMGDAFAEVFMRVARRDPALELISIVRWGDWDRRKELTGGADGTDLGIDLVAQHASGAWIAIQCKCYQESTRLDFNKDMSTFLAFASREPFELLWFVATCPWGKNAEKVIKGNITPPVQRIDFVDRYSDFPLEQAQREIREPWARQVDAIEYCTTGLSNYDRGQLIMACGTGKTFTALRIAEDVVPENGSILFMAPSIALVSRAREEWLTHAINRMGTVVICSDSTAGRSTSEDIALTELLSPVTTKPEKIAQTMARAKGTRVAYCTYQSSGRITEAQRDYGLADFDLIIADEAHRTTGIIKEKNVADANFQAVHDNELVKGKKRLYMTATPRIYSEKSKSSRRKEGWDVIDMGDKDTYGPEFFRLSFRKAVEATPEPMLSDYRIIVLGVGETDVSPSLKGHLEDIPVVVNKKLETKPDIHQMTRLLGVSLAINGHTKGDREDRPGVLRRSIAYANTIPRSRWYAEALKHPQLLSATTRKLEEGKALKVTAEHLDASSSAITRNIALRKLNDAGRGNDEARVISNVKLFTEGVDVPALDAVIFLDPKQSQIDIIQAVGRVMRKSEGKKFGYIIVPVVVQPNENVVEALEAGKEGYATVGKVLRSLQSHDEELINKIDLIVQLYDQRRKDAPPPDTGEQKGDDTEQLDFDFLDPKDNQQIFAHVIKASGLGKPGKVTADDIRSTVEYAGKILDKAGAAPVIAEALGLPYNEDGSLNTCKIGALLLANACLLQKRLSNEESLNMIIPLERIIVSKAPQELLKGAWDGIMNRDYIPVFEPAVAILDMLPDSELVNQVIQHLAECANRVADSLSELGYDHAGPLYHQILGSAKSDGAFYTENTSALMLARLAINKDFIDWGDLEAVKDIKIIDPACGTGTLLMASLKTIKDRVKSALSDIADNDVVQRDLHAQMVENSLCGLDINRHAVQLAACNLTMGAPTVDYNRMNLHTLAHGPDGNGGVKLGSLEILPTSESDTDFSSLALPTRKLNALGARQVNKSNVFNYPLKDLDLVIMNPPFTANDKRGQKFDDDIRSLMQHRELWIRDEVEAKDQQTNGVINSNSIATYFTPLSDRLLKSKNGTLAKVVATTACLNSSGIKEREFHTKKFQVELIVTSHDPSHPNFSGNTGITESLMICRRAGEGVERGDTRFVSLRKNPDNADDALKAADAIASGNLGEWGNEMTWSAEKMAKGDWRPTAFYNRDLLDVLISLESNLLVRLGKIAEVEPGGQRIRDAFDRSVSGDSDAKTILWDHKSELRTTMATEPDTIASPKDGRRDYVNNTLWPKAGRLLIAGKININVVRTTGVILDKPALGSMFIPVRPKASDEEIMRSYEKILCVWFNSTPFIICLLGARSKNLLYTAFSLDTLRSLPIPKPLDLMMHLTKIYDTNKDKTLKPWPEMTSCEVRKNIDDAVAPIIDIDSETIAKWREWVANEPTVTNKRAAFVY